MTELDTRCDEVNLTAEEREQIRRAWSVEVARRRREFEAGGVELIPWEEARRRIFGE